MNDEIHSQRRAFGSGAWATLQQFIALGSTALSAFVIARSVSVEDFGIFSYATSLAAMGSVVVTAGLSGLAIKALVDNPQSQRRTMTGLIVLREVMAVAAYLVILGVSATSGDGQTIAMTAIATSVLVARALDASEMWFQSRAESHKTAVVRIAVVLLMLGIRLVLAALGADVLTFVLIYVAEAVLISTLLLVRFLTDKESPKLGRPEPATPKALLRRSWLLALSSVASQINTRGDIVIIQALLGSASVGIYSAAARLSEMTYFLPAVFMTATFPRLLQIRRRFGTGSDQYTKELQSGYDRACWGGIAICAGLIALGPWVLEFVYGSRYAEAGDVLRIHALGLPFVFMAAVFSKWIIAEDLFVASLVRHALGAGLNITLNLLLVPSMGVIGSAWATVASYFVASFLSCFATRSTREAGWQMCLAFAAPVRFVVSWSKRRK